MWSERTDTQHDREDNLAAEVSIAIVLCMSVVVGRSGQSESYVFRTSLQLYNMCHFRTLGWACMVTRLEPGRPEEIRHGHVFNSTAGKVI